MVREEVVGRRRTTERGVFFCKATQRRVLALDEPVASRTDEILAQYLPFQLSDGEIIDERKSYCRVLMKGCHQMDRCVDHCFGWQEADAGLFRAIADRVIALAEPQTLGWLVHSGGNTGPNCSSAAFSILSRRRLGKRPCMLVRVPQLPVWHRQCRCNDLWLG